MVVKKQHVVKHIPHQNPQIMVYQIVLVLMKGKNSGMDVLILLINLLGVVKNNHNNCNGLF